MRYRPSPAKPAPVKKPQPVGVMYSAQMQNTSIPSMGWREWTGPELQLVLSPESTVLLREGDSVLAYVEDSGQLEIYGYRPRAEH